jgi:hypothetical protein
LIYEFGCNKCNLRLDKIRQIGYTAPEPCECGGTLERKYTPIRFKIDFTPGWDMGLGKYIGTKRERDTTADKMGLERRKDY